MGEAMGVVLGVAMSVAISVTMGVGFHFTILLLLQRVFSMLAILDGCLKFDIFRDCIPQPIQEFFFSIIRCAVDAGP